MSTGEDSDGGSSSPLGVRILWLAIAVALVALVWQVGTALTGGGGGPDVAEPREGELTVNEALGTVTERPIAVRGYVFMRERFPPELCTGRIPGEPPRCLGPSLVLRDLDLGRLDLRRFDDEGVEVVWTSEPVALLGRIDTATLTVTEILG